MKLKKLRILVLPIIFILILSACGAEEPVTVPGTGDEVPPEVVLQAQQELAAVLGTSSTEVEILEYQQVEWPDACLGVEQMDVVCAEVVTPGWDISFQVGGQVYSARTDEAGEMIIFPELVQ